jgi:hypothetical protein
LPHTHRDLLGTSASQDSVLREREREREKTVYIIYILKRKTFFSENVNTINTLTLKSGIHEARIVYPLEIQCLDTVGKENSLEVLLRDISMCLG